jgi:hypothetical protein
MSSHANRRRAWSVLCSVLLLGACGGGLYIDFEDDEPPAVELAVDRTSAQAGQTVQLTAAASDDDGIDWVFFYRLDGSVAVRVGDDGRRPYQAVAVVPSDGRSELRLFARAYDWSGNRTDSAVVSVAVTP